MQGIIGKSTRIVKSRNKDLEGIEGKIIDETQNMLIIKDSKNKRMVEKKTCVFSFGSKKIHGKNILGRPKDRIKKKKRLKKRW